MTVDCSVPDAQKSDPVTDVNYHVTRHENHRSRAWHLSFLTTPTSISISLFPSLFFFSRLTPGASTCHHHIPGAYWPVQSGLLVPMRTKQVGSSRQSEPSPEPHLTPLESYSCTPPASRTTRIEVSGISAQHIVRTAESSSPESAAVHLGAAQDVSLSPLSAFFLSSLRPSIARSDFLFILSSS